MPDLAPEVRELISRIDTMMVRVQAAGPAGGGTLQGIPGPGRRRRDRRPRLHA
jgi:hypothetical protein